MAREAAAQSSKWYFVIFLGLATAAAVVGTTEPTGSTATAAQLLAFIVGAAGVSSLWMEFREPSRSLATNQYPQPACKVDERPAKHKDTVFPA